jgi:hypothetical protein
MGMEAQAMPHELILSAGEQIQNSVHVVSWNGWDEPLEDGTLFAFLFQTNKCDSNTERAWNSSMLISPHAQLNEKGAK